MVNSITTKVHTWCHDDDNVLMSPSCALCSHHPCFVQKTFLVSMSSFPSFHNPTYTHNDVLFSIAPQSYVHHTLSCLGIFTLLHFLVIYFIFASSHYCCILLWLCTFTFHHASSTSLGCFFIVFTCFTSLCFSLLYSFLFVRGDHYPLAKGLSPFKGSSFLSPYLHCRNFFLVVFVCFMVLLGLLQVVVFYYKHQRLVFPLFFLLFVATFFSITVITFLVPTLTSISNMTWFIYVDVVLCVGCILYV